MPSGKPIKWMQYDNLIRQHLPDMTIEEFTATHLPHISSKAVGARARKLKIRPKKRSWTEEQRLIISMRMTRETPELIDKIRAIRQRKSITQICEDLNIDDATLWRIIKRYNIELTEEGQLRARSASAAANVGKEPWNKGKKLSEEVKIKIAAGRQRQSGRLSALQAAFYVLLDELGINYYKECERQCLFGPWTFDCRINHGKFDYVVEVQGNYIHSLPKNVNKDQAKATYMERYFPDVPIRYIWEHEFGSINLAKSKVRQWLELDVVEHIDFDFDKISTSNVDSVEASQFLTAFHYLSKSNGIYRIGAYCDDKLVAVSVWGAPTRTETTVRIGRCLELRRFVIHDSYHKKNFASWLLARFEKHLPAPMTLVSFADVGAGHSGTIYKAANWTPDGETEPSHFYVNDAGFVMLKKTLYNQATSLRMSESDFADTYGYHKVLTPKKLRFIKRLI